MSEISGAEASIPEFVLGVQLPLFCEKQTDFEWMALL